MLSERANFSATTVNKVAQIAAHERSERENGFMPMESRKSKI
jgi:hypothetical protein